MLVFIFTKFGDYSTSLWDFRKIKSVDVVKIDFAETKLHQNGKKYELDSEKKFFYSLFGG